MRGCARAHMRECTRAPVCRCAGVLLSKLIVYAKPGDAPFAESSQSETDPGGGRSPSGLVREIPHAAYDSRVQEDSGSCKTQGGHYVASELTIAACNDVRPDAQ